MEYLQISPGKMKIALSAKDRSRYGFLNRKADGCDSFSSEDLDALEAIFRDCGKTAEEGRSLVQCFLAKDGSCELFVTDLQGRTFPDQLLRKNGNYALVSRKKRYYFFPTAENLRAALPHIERLTKEKSDLYLDEVGHYILSVSERSVRSAAGKTLSSSSGLLEFSSPFLPRAQSSARTYLREHAKILFCDNATRSLSEIIKK